MLSAKRRRRVNVQTLFIPLFVLILLLCLVMFFSIYLDARRDAIEGLNAQQEIHAKLARIGLERFFDETVAWLSVLAGSDHIGDLDETGRHEMDVACNLRRRAVTAVTRVDNAGVIIYSTPDQTSSTGVDISSQEHMRRIFATHGPVASGVFTAVEGYPAIAIHVPVYHVGRFAGTIGILIDFATVTADYLDQVRIGRTGYAWLLDSDGVELYCLVPGHVGNSVYENCADFPSIVELADKMLDGHDGVTTYEFDHIMDDHVQVVTKHAVYLPIRVVDRFWSIVVASSEAEVLAGLVDLRNSLLLYGALFFLSSVLLSYYAVRARAAVRESASRAAAESERKELERRMQEAQRMESIGTLAGGIAHDFNNILAPIIGYAELLLADLPPDSPHRENVDAIVIAGQRGADLVSQILAFGRRSERSPIAVSLQHVIADALKLARSTIPANIEITQRIDPECGAVVADPTQLHQVVMNLVTNAYHAVEEKGGSIGVELSEVRITSGNGSPVILPNGRYARLSVSDDGCGIAPESIERIFDPYYTTKAKGKGSGLGLAVVFGIVKERGGDIRVESRPGEGAQFDVYLPVTDGKPVDEGSGEVPPAASGKGRILIVDDERAVLDVERRMLERLGYGVDSFVSSVEAIEAFRSDPDRYDLVITDMAMPKMTGDRLAKELLAAKPEIPVIICTGYSERMNGDVAKALGIKRLLSKPIDWAGLGEAVREALGD